MKKLLWISLIALTACGRAAPTPTATPIPPTATQPSATAAITRTIPPAAATPLPTPSEPTAFTITVADGAQLAAAYYPPIVRPAPAVLLLHMVGGSKNDWDSFARGLQKQGYAAMAIDFRGHGSTGGPENWAKAPDDARAAWNVLVARPEVDANRTALVGASIGANTALIVGAAEPRLLTAIALSPGLDYHGLEPADSMAKFADRPVLLAASQDDSYSYQSVQQLDALAIAAETLFFTNAGHGTFMLANPDLEPAMVEWLNKYVRDLKG